MLFYGLGAFAGGVFFGLFLPPIYWPIAFGLFVGLGLAIVAWFTSREIVPLGIYMLVGSIFQSVAVPGNDKLAAFSWFILGGGAFASIGALTRSMFGHFVGMAFLFGVLGVYLVGGDFFLMATVGAFIILASLAITSLYMYRTLGRAPKMGEILTLAARALFTYGLRRPLDQYRLIAIAIQGNIGTEQVLNELVAKLEPRWHPILLLGPTAPTQIRYPRGARIGWITSLSGVADREYAVLSPSNPSDVNLFVADAVKHAPQGSTPVIIGDFLDNMIPLMKDDSFFRYYSELASRIKLQNHTGVLIIKSDIHPEVAVNVVKRFADVIIENREREERNRLIREVRVSNKVDNIHTEWQRVPTLAH